jgi:uncharacterized protein
MNDLRILNPVEIRVLGSLIEKSRTTPDYYPMTVNSITAACNQKSSRNPIVDYSEQEVIEAINSLKGRSLVSTAIGGGSRTIKYKHNFTTVYEVSDAQLALLCLLFLRGPQTPGELNTNSARLYSFSSLSSVQENLIGLSTTDPPYVKELPRRTGQKETRYVHLFSSYDMSAESETQTTNISSRQLLEERLASVEAELAALKSEVERIVKAIF